MKNVEYWEDLKIPAYLFFDIIETNDLQLLVRKFKHKDDKLKKAWLGIYDLYFEKREDPKMSDILKLQGKIALMKLKQDKVTDALKVLSILNLPQDLLETVCTGLKKLKIYIDPKKEINKEVLRALQIDINNLKVQIEAEIETLKTLTQGKKSTFEDACVGIENTLDRTIDEQVSLGKFLSLEKSAKEKIKQQKANEAKRKK